MKRKLTALFVLIATMHASAILQSCIFSRCENVAYYVSANDTDILVYSVSPNPSDGWDLKPPFRRETINLRIDLKSVESISSAGHTSIGNIISFANAKQDCDGDYPVFEEYIRSIQVLLRFDLEGNTLNQDISSDFLAHEGLSNELYTETQSWLANGSRTSLSLAYKKVGLGDSLGLIIMTHLSDDRVLSDTLNIQLK